MNDFSGYTDIHAHILPGVDDGAQNMDETIRMLQLANDQGITTIIATPHFAIGGKNTPTRTLETIREQVQQEASRINQDMRILLGNELYYSDSVLEALKQREALTLAGSRYVLVEFSPRESYRNIYKAIGNLIRAGYLPILAHVERYQCLRKQEELIREITELGCYIQMNSDSLIGGMFHSEANYNRKLVNQGFVHFIASDCHNSKNRVPCMQTIVNLLQKKCETGLMEQIFGINPRCILDNTYI